MVRAPFVDENGVKKGAWSVEEDNKLRSYIQRYGHWNWRELPKFAGLARCGKSCRLRWINYLKPNVKHGCYTKEEEELLIKLHNQLGNRWSKIARNLPGRTDNEIKNYWHTHLRKRFQQKVTTHKKKMTKKSQSHNSQIDNNVNTEETNLHILESYPLSPDFTKSITESCSLNSGTSSSPLSEYIHINSVNTFDGLKNTPSVSEYISPISSKELIDESLNEQTVWNGGSIYNENTESVWSSIGEGEFLDHSFWTQPFGLETYQQYDDYGNFEIIDEGLLLSSPNTLSSSYLEIMDFSCLFTSDVII